jgi:4-amino-4-deoxy-L-arabinose transferase-like glycosyltransferase
MDRRREVLRQWLHGRLADRRTPLALLGVVCLLGIGLRAFHLGIPAASRPGQGYIFDEHYYVSAARIIAGEPVTAGDVYAGTAPAGADPNGEHPQLGKIIIAAGIVAFGDNTIGWRITAVLFGAAAILLLYWLVRCAGGGAWLALAAASLASVDNLWVVHSRIAVLDIYVVPFMLAGVALYLRRRPIVAGVLIGVGCCVKEFAAYAVFVLLLFELLRALRRLWARRAGLANAHDSAPASAAGVMRALAVAVLAAATYFSLLTALDKVATPYSGGHPVDRNQASVCQDVLIWSDGCNHFTFMNHYAGKLRDVGPPRGIAARPLEFWLNRKAITYFRVTERVRAHGSVTSTTTAIWFRGEISRVLLVTSWFAILLTVWWAVRRRDDLSLLVLAWILGTWLPPELFNLIDDRTTYLYYMVVTMPALYIAVARLLALRRIPRWVVGTWIVLLLVDAASLYPFRTLSGS